jgi:hypothetical protein
VPSQDDVLKDNKRCYDNILSECGITNPLQIYSGWLDEHESHDQSYNPNRKAAYHPDFTPIGLWTKAAYNKNRLM